VALFGRGGEVANGRRFMMQEKFASVGDDSWIEDADGNRVYKVNGKALRVRETYILEDPEGNELAKIQERKLSIRNKMVVERGDQTLATVHKALVGLRDRFTISVEGGGELKAHGNIVDHEYEIERDGTTVAIISRKWFRVRATYGVEIAAGEDESLILALTVAIDGMTTVT